MFLLLLRVYIRCRTKTRLSVIYDHSLYTRSRVFGARHYAALLLKDIQSISLFTTLVIHAFTVQYNRNMFYSIR